MCQQSFGLMLALPLPGCESERRWTRKQGISCAICLHACYALRCADVCNVATRLHSLNIKEFGTKEVGPPCWPTHTLVLTRAILLYQVVELIESMRMHFMVQNRSYRPRALYAMSSTALDHS